MAVQQVTYGNKALRIEGLRELNKKLSKAANATQDMPDLMHKLGNIVISYADDTVPIKSGALMASMRAGRGRTKSVVRAGYKKRASYAGVIHYGNPHRGTRAQPFLVSALRRARPELVTELSTGLDNILTKHNLK